MDGSNFLQKINKRIVFLAVRDGFDSTSSTWCGGQVPTYDMCNQNGLCDLIVPAGITLTIGSAENPQQWFTPLRNTTIYGTLRHATSLVISGTLSGTGVIRKTEDGTGGITITGILNPGRK
ncbi:unnamed protein product [Didymodactylos carnosus]|uniref:Uncharacterized protein n=1 Tax=Didymodactylos carnosus TaxID=1234261 RepID=A0A8S2GVT4_9BILA|nr:unnamed protein product [Didymodactylos carnosus]CAF3559186.1 unnamed protein product [Didymodactylos carnosus]